MKCFSKTILIFILAMFIMPMAHTQDLDNDGINDQLEAALAKKFAPEWRFHQEVPNDGSNQNETELFYPCSVEYFYNQIVAQWGQPPQLTYDGLSSPIQDINHLDDMIVPGTAMTASDESWETYPDDGKCGYGKIRMDYPEKIPGDPSGFPTYFRCNKNSDGKIEIGYFLFFPFDYKGSYCIIYIPFVGCEVSIEKGKHRGDWEGINILLSGVDDLSDVQSVESAFLEDIKYSGHGVSRHIRPGDPSFRVTEGFHPKVYLSFGSHTPYPEPGEWHNFEVETWWPDWLGAGILDIYDDFFHGNGVVAKSWSPFRSLINVGETDGPLVGWLNYKGWWGPDDNGANSSPPGPVCKSVWTHSLNNYYTWSEAQLPENYLIYWENGFEPDCTPDDVSLMTANPGYACNLFVDCRIDCPVDSLSFDSVSVAIDSAVANNTICLYPCYYNESLIIKKPLIMKAVEGLVVIGAGAPSSRNRATERLGYDGENPNQSFNITIFPNPTSSHIQWSDEFCKNVSVLTANGQILLISTGANQIDLSPLPQGIYFLRIQDHKGSIQYAKVMKI